MLGCVFGREFVCMGVWLGVRVCVFVVCVECDMVIWAAETDGECLARCVGECVYGAVEFWTEI